MSELRKAAQQALKTLESMSHEDSIFAGEFDEEITALRAALAEPERKPVAIVVSRQYEDGSHAGNLLEWSGRNEADDFPVGTKFYTAPTPRKPLTYDELEPLCEAFDSYDTTQNELVEFARAIERAHGIGEQHE